MAIFKRIFKWVLFISLFFFFPVSITFFHEFGHYFALKMFGCNVGYFKVGDYESGALLFLFNFYETTFSLYSFDFGSVIGVVKSPDQGVLNSWKGAVISFSGWVFSFYYTLIVFYVVWKEMGYKYGFLKFIRTFHKNFYIFLFSIACPYFFKKEYYLNLYKSLLKRVKYTYKSCKLYCFALLYQFFCEVYMEFKNVVPGFLGEEVDGVKGIQRLFLAFDKTLSATQVIDGVFWMVIIILLQGVLISYCLFVYRSVTEPWSNEKHLFQ